jgi:hypothetical protein
MDQTLQAVFSWMRSVSESAALAGERCGDWSQSVSSVVRPSVHSRDVLEWNVGRFTDRPNPSIGKYLNVRKCDGELCFKRSPPLTANRFARGHGTVGILNELVKVVSHTLYPHMQHGGDGLQCCESPSHGGLTTCSYSVSVVEGIGKYEPDTFWDWNNRGPNFFYGIINPSSYTFLLLENLEESYNRINGRKP